MKVTCDPSHLYLISELAAKVKSLLERVEYRQRDCTWVLSGIGMPGWSSIRMTLITQVKDIVSGKMISLHTSGPTIHPDFPEDMHIRLVHDTLRRLEIHELNEHFYFEGIKIYDPHKNDSVVNTPHIFSLAETTLQSVR